MYLMSLIQPLQCIDFLVLISKHPNSIFLPLINLE